MGDVMVWYIIVMSIHFILQEVVKALIEEAEEYSYDMKKSLETFFRAMNICVKYHLKEESILIVKSDIYCKSILNAIDQGLSQ